MSNYWLESVKPATFTDKLLAKKIFLKLEKSLSNCIVEHLFENIDDFNNILKQDLYQILDNSYKKGEISHFAVGCQSTNKTIKVTVKIQVKEYFEYITGEFLITLDSE